MSGGVGDGVGEGSSSSSPLQMPVTQIRGIRASNGHLGNPPPTLGISPQSQIVPSIFSCSITSTLPCPCCWGTWVPSISDNDSTGPAEAIESSGATFSEPDAESDDGVVGS